MLDKPIEKPSIIGWLILIIPIFFLCLFLFLNLFINMELGHIIIYSVSLIFVSFAFGLVVSTIGYIILRKRKTTYKELVISFFVLIIFLFILISIIIYVIKGSPYLYTIEQWEKMDYSFPIETSKEALAYAKDVKNPTVNDLYTTPIAEIRDIKYNKEEKWLAWIKHDRGLWFVEITHGEYTSCTTHRIYVVFNETGYAKRDIIPNLKKYYEFWVYHLSNDNEFDAQWYIDRCSFGY